MRPLLLFLSLLTCLPLLAQHEKEMLYVGTYSIRDSKGIYVFEFNRSKGATKLVQTIDGLSSPTFLAIHPNNKFLYAVNRGSVEGFENSGSVSAYSIDQKTGRLTFLNHVPSFGKEPCHIALDRTGRFAFVSNYTEGNFVVLSVHEDGTIGAVTDSKKYSGNGPNRLRQDQPHIHSAEISSDNRFVYVSDLGTDKIYMYEIDHKVGKITAIGQGYISLAPGAGPRHFSFHPGLNIAYSAEELSSTVAILNVNLQSGQLTLVRDTLNSLPKDVKAVNTSADIHVHPKGKFLYLSNRGHDALAIYTIDQMGMLTLKGHQKTHGKTPRNFLIDQKGKFLWAANQNTDNISTFTIHPKTGLLTPQGMLKVPSPVCVKQLILR